MYSILHNNITFYPFGGGVLVLYRKSKNWTEVYPLNWEREGDFFAIKKENYLFLIDVTYKKYQKLPLLTDG